METTVTRYFVRKRQRMQIDGKVGWVDVGTEVDAKWIPREVIPRMVRMGFLEARNEVVVSPDATASLSPVVSEPKPVKPVAKPKEP